MEQELGIQGSYVIHLSTKHERDHIIDELRQIGFQNIQNYDAVVGKNLRSSFEYISPRVMLELAEGRTSNEGIVSMGAIGCYLSHINIWKEMLADPNISAIAIFEDDVDTSQKDEVRQKLLNISEAIQKKDYDILFMGFSPRCNKNLPIINERYTGNYSYIITRSGAKKLLRFAFPIDMHLDAYIGTIAKYDPTVKLLGYQIFKHNGTLGSSDTSVGDWLGWSASGDCYPKENFKVSSSGKSFAITFAITAFILIIMLMYFYLWRKK